MRIALVVDNPTRDLDGLVLLARELAKKNHHVFLVPMYSAGYEIPLLACDFALFNYARYANKELLQTLHAAGIKIGILDTEGGIWESPDQFVKSVAHKETANCIDQYYLWGPVQRAALVESSSFKPEILKVTGCPRYDLCVAPWSASIRDLPEHKGCVLIISNFALSNPRFVKVETEIQNMIAAGYERHYAEARAKDEVEARHRLTDVIQKAAKLFPQKAFVIRTHPFEDDSFYKNSFSSFENVKIVREGPVSMWLKAASLTLHINSSVGVDAALMGVPLYSADWISTSIAQGMSELPLLVSQRLHSFDDFTEAISHPAAPPKNSPQQKALEDWFYLNDGRAHSRVSDEITRYLNESQTNTVNKNQNRKLFFSGSKQNRSLVSVVDSSGRLIFGARTYRWIRNRILTKNLFQQTKSDKFFTAGEVDSFLQRLNSIDSTSVSAKSVAGLAPVYSRAAGDSVLVSRSDFKNP